MRLAYADGEVRAIYADTSDVEEGPLVIASEADLLADFAVTRARFRIERPIDILRRHLFIDLPYGDR